MGEVVTESKSYIEQGRRVTLLSFPRTGQNDDNLGSSDSLGLL